MITTKSIRSTNWVAITTAGQKGSAWVSENKKGSGGVYISHSDNGLPAEPIGFRIYKPNDNTNMVLMGPDNSNDIFYARCLKPRNRIIICVDVI